MVYYKEGITISQERKEAEERHRLWVKRMQAIIVEEWLRPRPYRDRVGV